MFRMMGKVYHLLRDNDTCTDPTSKLKKELHDKQSNSEKL